MKILFIAHRLPYPPNKGDKIRAFNMLQYLAKDHEVHLATLIDDRDDERYVDVLSKMVSSVNTADMSGQRKAMSAVAAVLSGRSISQEHFHSRDLQARVDELLEKVDLDLIFCSSSTSAEYLYRSKRGMENLDSQFKVMDFMDVDSLKWQQYADDSSWPLSLVYRREAGLLSAFEQAIGRDFQRLLFVSPNEAELFPGTADSEKIMAIRNGVDLDYFSPRSDYTPTNPPTLVFVGMMDYPPNIDGMRWFINDVFPDVRSEIPGCRLLVVGGRPTAEVMRWGRIDGITVTGFVDDVREYMAEGTLSIVPLRIARGIQNKVLEAMAMAMPVVATRFALEGLECEPGRDVISADSADEFGRAIRELVSSPQRARTIGAAARQFAENHHSWAGQLARLGDVLALAKAAPASSPIHRQVGGSEQ